MGFFACHLETWLKQSSTALEPLASREAWVRWSITASIAVSFPLDTGRSLLHKVYANAALNTALLVVIAIPLIGTFGEFH